MTALRVNTGPFLQARELLAIHDRLAALHARRAPTPALDEVEALLAQVRETSHGVAYDPFTDAAAHAVAIAREHSFGSERRGVAFIAAAILLRRAGHILRAPESEAAVMTRALANGALEWVAYARWLRRWSSPSAASEQAPPVA